MGFCTVVVINNFNIICIVIIYVYFDFLLFDFFRLLRPLANLFCPPQKFFEVILAPVEL